MSNGAKDREDVPPAGIPDDLNPIDQAMLLAISHRQRDDTPLSLDQERLLDSWIAGRLPSNDADRAAELTKHNKLAAERILERRLIAAANESPDVPSVLSTRVLRASRPPRTRSGGIFSLQWPTLSAWQWSGVSAAAASLAVVAVFGFQVWQAQLRSNQNFQIAMVTLEDRSVLVEGSRYRTRGGQQQALQPADATRQPADATRQPADARRQAAAPVTSPSDNPTENRFRDIDVPTSLLRRAISGASYAKQSIEHSELMTYLRTQNESFDSRARILIDSALADSVSESTPERTSTQIRAYDLNDPTTATIRGKIPTLPANARAILLTLKR